ncbi:DNA recombination protein RmuC [Silvibacterium bohemicum]|uniref:DNA recombination protein RmuC n=1 Tax=Silvibacterium bohemicum TaxID=1577686 RepID=A0A841K5S0_9BACT|nr:DNA recombination protein RmuC [Silvibacterium bohemicum]MBB6145948.1 DNA recombination protein RmuC [Silvibacterium bohemicum]
MVIALAAAGLAALLAWLAAKAATGQRAEGLAAEVSQKSAALDAVMREKSAAEANWNERDAKQRSEIARLEAGNSHLQQRVEALQSECTSNESLKDQLRGDISGLKSTVAELTAKFEAEKNASQEKLTVLTSARKELSDQFEALANRILDEKSKKFTDQNEANLGNLIKPLKEKFGEFQTKVESLEKDGLTGRTELKTQIEQLRTLNERLSQDATNLVSALRGSSKTQGDWGELVLESILESSGLRKGYEYRVQESFTREDRTRARLDVILDLPEGRHLVLDSKVSLNDYNDACSAVEDSLRDAALGRHLTAVRTHIRDLSKRDYHALYSLNSLDFVIMFVPIEPAFIAAIGRDNKLWQEAWEKSVLLVSPSTLLFVLRTVAQLWRQEQQTKNVQEIVRRGSELYDKLAAFAKDLTDVGKSLDAARSSYDDAYKKLAQGKGNAIRQAEMLKELGVKPVKSLQQSLPPKLAGLAFQDEQDGSDDGLSLAAKSDEETALNRRE